MIIITIITILDTIIIVILVTIIKIMIINKIKYNEEKKLSVQPLPNTYCLK